MLKMRNGRAAAWAGPVAVFIVAVCVRAALVLRSSGGAFGDFGYDSSVYFGAADALIHGRMPYADFILLHPPAIMLTLTPFAWFGTVTSDHLGFVVANGAFTVLGGLNAALVVVLARRLGTGGLPALAGGLFYAAWPGAAAAETCARLEPLGNFFLLGGLLVLTSGTRDKSSAIRLMLGGALLGAATTTKIWGVVPLIVLAVWVTRRRWRNGVLFIAGAAVSMSAIAGPFFLYAPKPMWRMVVREQLDRSDAGISVLARLSDLTLVSTVLPSTSDWVVALCLLPIGALTLAACVRTWRRVELRSVVALALAQLLVLLAAPVYFNSYADYVAPAGALVLAGAVAVSPAKVRRSHVGLSTRSRTRLVIGTVSVIAIAASTAAQLVVNAPAAIVSFPGAELARAASRPGLHCVMADSPMALIELNVLSRDFTNGCPDRVDVSGSTYGVDRPRHDFVQRVDNKRWQRDLYRYLTSGNAEIVIRNATGVGPRLRHRLNTLPLIASRDGYALRRTP